MATGVVNPCEHAGPMEHDQGIGVYRWRYSTSSSVNIEDISAFCSVIIACCSAWLLMRVIIMALRSASSEVCWVGVLAVAATSLAGAGCRVSRVVSG